MIGFILFDNFNLDLLLFKQFQELISSLACIFTEA